MAASFTDVKFVIIRALNTIIITGVVQSKCSVMLRVHGLGACNSGMQNDKFYSTILVKLMYKQFNFDLPINYYY